MSWRKASLTAQIVLGTYVQVVEWIDLFPWNDLRYGNGQEKADIALGAVQSGLILGTLKGWRAAAVLAPAAYGLWLAAQIATWWYQYLLAPEPTDIPDFYQRYFARTYQFLPARGKRMVPDANHLVLQGLIATALVVTLKASGQPGMSDAAERF
jgi:hypothetical protein